MVCHRISIWFLCSLCLLSVGCTVEAAEARPFHLGFTTWPYAATVQAVEETNSFVTTNADLICEQIDENLPWDEALRGGPFPSLFLKKMEGRRSALVPGLKRVLYITPMNLGRNGLLASYSDAEKRTSPKWERKLFNDPDVLTAYVNYCVWMVNCFKPDYLVVGIETNEYLQNVPAEWDHYRSFSRQIHKVLKRRFPALPLSESVTLHALLDPKGPDPRDYRAKVRSLIAEQDFCAVSFYPFFLGMRSPAEISRAFDAIHEYTSKPIAFVETGQPAETIDIPSLKFNFPLTPADQNAYLATLLKRARQDRYLFVVWWAHRDFDALWESFPANVKDLGRCWRDIGLLDDQGHPRPALTTWREALSATYHR